MEAYLDAKLRLFSEVVDGGRHGGGLDATTRPSARGDRAAAQRAACELLTVGRQGETLRLVEREPTPLGQTLTHRGGRQDASRRRCR